MKQQLAVIIIQSKRKYPWEQWMNPQKPKKKKQKKKNKKKNKQTKKTTNVQKRLTVYNYGSRLLN